MVFLSYSRQDQLRVEHLQEALRFRGLDVWMDRSSILGGDPWWRAIESAIASCTAAIVAVSPYSLASPMVQREIAAIENMRKPLIPVMVDGDPAAAGRFQTAHCIPLYSQPFQSALDQIGWSLAHHKVNFDPRGTAPVLSQVIDGTWNIKTETPQGPSRLTISLTGNSSFTGQLFGPADPDGFAYQGRWQALTSCELLLQGTLRSFRNLQMTDCRIDFGFTALARNELRGFTLPQLGRCSWHRIA